MPGGFAIGSSGFANFNDAGAVVGSSTGTSLSSNVSANTKATSYTQLVASTPYDCCGIIVSIGKAGTNLPYSIDIAVGASSSEQIIIPDIYFDLGNATASAQQYFFPVAIPAGTRISARAQCNRTLAQTICVNVTLVDGGFDTPQSLGNIKAYGFTAASTVGTLVDPGGTANTKNTTYTQIVSSTTYDIGALMVCFGTNHQGSATTANVLFWLAIGAAASEVDIIPALQISTVNQVYMIPAMIYLPGIYIPAGTRLSATAASTNNSSGTRKIDTVVYGIAA